MNTLLGVAYLALDSKLYCRNKDLAQSNMAVGPGQNIKSALQNSENFWSGLRYNEAAWVRIRRGLYQVESWRAGFSSNTTRPHDGLAPAYSCVEPEFHHMQQPGRVCPIPFSHFTADLSVACCFRSFSRPALSFFLAETHDERYSTQ